MPNTAANLVGATLQFGNISNSNFIADNNAQIIGEADNTVRVQANITTVTGSMTIQGAVNALGGISGALTGNAVSASRLQTARTIALSGGAVGSVSFDGSANVSIAVTITNNGHTHTSANISDATESNIGNTVVRRNASGNFSAGTITATLAGNASSATTADQVRGVNFYIGTTNPTGVTRLNADCYLYATRVYNSVWNDIADLLDIEDGVTIEPGKVYVKDSTGHRQSKRYAEKGSLGIASDTYGFGVGQKENTNQLPLAIGGIVLAYVDREYQCGTPLVSTQDGNLTEANIFIKIFASERILATYYKPERNKHWNNVEVKNRSWVKV
jgi:hypothetical protein